jgi:superfamily II DNA or RNA helicase
MTRNDTGIDACNLIDTIVQCKLRKDSLRWEDCGTFFGSQNIFNSELKKTVVRWDNLIITRNKECKLSKNLKDKYELYTDITFTHDEIINYCDKLIKNPPKIKIQKDETFKLRDYQKEAIDIINHNKNVIISLPTGCGKNIVIIFSMNEQKRYLILVPRIILMEQIKSEIIKHKPDFKNQIQTIGDNNNEYDKDKNITICVYNSISVIEKYCNTFDKIFIDEAHHINIPEIYEHEEEIINQDDTDSEDNMSDDEYYSDEEETESIRDDTEDEIKNTTGFNKIIKSLSKYNNNIYLSATIDDINDFTYYKKDIRDMIDNKYLCDYTIHIPIFSDDPSNKNICEHLLRNYKNIIIYCNSQKEGNKINELLNSLQNSCSEYIDCKTSKSKRDKIVKKYKEGEIPFLVNVRILVEGFDAPITKGVCFIHLPSSKTTAIQIIGRALRLHPLKTFANIILPFSNKDDESNINKFLKILAQNDTRIRKSYESKIEGGYISIEKIKDDGNDIENENDTKMKILSLDMK